MADSVVSGEGQGGMVLSFSGEDTEPEERSAEASEDQQSEASGEQETIDLDLGDEEEPREEDEEDLLLEQTGKDDKEPRIPKSRLDKQRDKFTKRIEKLEGELAEAKKPSQVEQGFLQLYGKFKNPLESAGSDLRFMDALESLRGEPDVQMVIQKVTAKMEGKPLPQNTAREETRETTDPRIDKLVHQEKGRRVSEFLRDARVDPKGEYWKGLRKEMTARVGDVDIDDLDDETLVKIAKHSLRELGWTAKQVQGQRRSKATEEPPTGTIKSAARSRATGESGKAGESRDPVTVRDWEEQGRELIRGRLANRASP